MFHVRLGNCTFLGAINAWVALGASEDATARAAARALDSLVWRVVHTASRSKSLAAGAVVAAVARGAASAPGLRLAVADTGVALALAPADAVEAPSSTFGLEATLPTPEIVMTDASASTSAGAALEGVAPAPAAVEEALQNAESEEVAATSSHLATLQRYLAEAVREDIFRPGLKNACSALCKAKYEPRHMRITNGIQLEIGDPAALRAVLHANGVNVQGLDLVRGGARYDF